MGRRQGLKVKSHTSILQTEKNKKKKKKKNNFKKVLDEDRFESGSGRPEKIRGKGERMDYEDDNKAIPIRAPRSQRTWPRGVLKKKDGEQPLSALSVVPPPAGEPVEESPSPPPADPVPSNGGSGRSTRSSRRPVIYKDKTGSIRITPTNNPSVPKTRSVKRRSTSSKTGAASTTMKVVAPSRANRTRRIKRLKEEADHATRDELLKEMGGRVRKSSQAPIGLLRETYINLKASGLL
jgi:hypothetical protein